MRHLYRTACGGRECHCLVGLDVMQVIPEIKTALAPSPPSSSTLAEMIQRQFAAFADGKQQAKCMLMIDPALRDAADDADFHECVTAWHKTVDYKLPYVRIRWEHPNLVPDHRPYLLTLDPRREADARLLEASAQLALDDWAVDSLAQRQGHRICGWIMTEPHPALYFGRLAIQRLPSNAPNAGQQTLLRFYDPSVMPLLWRFSDTTQHQNLLGPVETWLMLDRSLQLTAYQVPDKSEQYLASSYPLLKYRAEQWLKLNNIGALNQAILQWQIKTGLPPANTQIDAAAQALIRARHYGINDEQDLNAFAWHALTVHAHFDEHQLIKQALRRLPREEYYTAAVADLSEQDWRQVQLGVPNA